MDEWKDTPLSEVADLLPGYAFKGMDFGVGTSRGVKIKDVQTGVVAVETLDALDVTGYNQERIKKYRLNAGDHLITMTGNLGRVATIPDSPHSIYLNQRVAKLLPKANVVEDFLLYVIKSSDFIDYCITHADSETAQPNISAGTILDYEFSLPPENEQRAIASVLSSLDAKIDLLHRQNKTLEAMAEALFRQWFVEEAEEVWEEVGLLDVVKLVPGGTPKTTQSNYWDGDIMWISVREISENHKGFVNYAYKTITEEGLNNSAANLLPKFGTVISARGTVGKIGLLAQPMAYSQSNFGVLPKDSSNYFFTYMLVHNSIEELHSNSYGAVFDTITTQSFQTIRHRLPGTEVINSFEALVRPMFLKMLNNTEQITSLTKLRDTLLPKLMSGEVRVAETVILKVD